MHIVNIKGASKLHVYVDGRGRGGSDRGSYFIPKEIPTSEFFYTKKSLPFSIPQKNPTKKSLFFFVTLKNPGIFHILTKIPFSQNFRPRKSFRPQLPGPSLKRCEWSPWGLEPSNPFATRVLMQHFAGRLFEHVHKLSISIFTVYFGFY